MDPLQLPLISKYEWEYKNDINQRMRVPDKLSVAASLPDLGTSSPLHKDAQYPDQSVSKVEHPQNTPGYSPDLLVDGEDPYISSSGLRTRVHASATASATVQVSQGNSDAVADGVSGCCTTSIERLRTAETRLSHLEAYVSRLSSRLRAVEQQQAFIGGMITVYLGLKLMRFLVSALFK